MSNLDSLQEGEGMHPQVAVDGTSGFTRILHRCLRGFVALFGVWLFGSAGLAIVYPPSFAWYSLTWIDPMLGVVMLGMGLTLTTEDFRRIVRMPRRVFLGVILQFTLMPAAGYVAAQAFSLENSLALGLILVACCPGGTASNVIAYIARADVALSVSMTTMSTLFAVVLTPLLATWLANNRVSVDPKILLWGTAKVVLVPVLSGYLIRRYLPRLTARLLPMAPAVAVVCIVLIVAGITSSMQQRILESGLVLIAAVGTVHCFGAALGYGFSRWLTGDAVCARTTAIEVGMQNGGLGISLANSGAFASPLMVALPCAFSGLMSCFIGSVLAAVWSRRPVVVDVASEGDADRLAEVTPQEGANR